MKKFIGIMAVLLLFNSCSSDLDFNQASDLKLTPIIIGNFATFEVKATQFVSSGVEESLAVGQSHFAIVDYLDTTEKNVTRADFLFEFTNTINRDYLVTVRFFDSNDAQVYSIEVPVSRYSGTATPVEKTEIFENNNLALLRTSYKITFDVLMLPGIPLTDTSTGSLKMRSSSTIYINSK